MLKSKYALSFILLCSCISTVNAMKEEGKEEGKYTRPGTTLVVEAKQGPSSSKVKKILEERKEQLAPTATLSTLDAYFCGKSCKVQGPVGEIFDLYASSGKADLTVADRALVLLPANHVLSVHTYQPVKTKEGEPALVVQNSESRDGAPTKFTGVVTTLAEEVGKYVKVSAIFDLTGSSTPLLSVVKQELALSEEGNKSPDPKSPVGQFQKELKSIGPGLKHVAVYAPEGTTIPISRNGAPDTTTALRLKVPLIKN